MDSPNHSAISGIDLASSRLACLDLNNEEALHPMETDTSMEVPDTPDRVTARYERDIACEVISSSSSTSHHSRDDLRIRRGFLRRDGLQRFPKNIHYEARGSNSVARNINGSARRENFGSPKLGSLEAQSSIFRGGGNTEHDLQDGVTISGQAGASGKKDPNVHRKVTDVRLKDIRDSGMVRCINDATDHGKDLNKYSGFDSTQVINLDSSPESSASASRMDSVSCEPSNHSAEIRRIMNHGGRVNPRSDLHCRRLQDECKIVVDQRMSMRNGYLSQRTTGSSIKGGTLSGLEDRLLDKDTSHDKGKSIALSHNSVSSSKVAQLSSDVDVCSRIVSSTTLGENSCISPANIARNKSIVAEAKHFSSNNLVSEAPQIVSPRQMHSLMHCNGKKGRNILDEGQLHNSEVETRSSRSRSGTIASNVSDVDEDISLVSGKEGWKTTGNRRGLSNGARHLRRHAHENNGNAGQHMNIVHNIDGSDSYASQTDGCSRSKPLQIFSNVDHNDENVRWQGSPRQIKGKRKTRSGQSLQGETSITESSDLLSHSLGESSNVFSASTSNADGCNALPLSIIDVDEYSPRRRHSRPRNGDISVSDGPSDRALQVESDALLARQLQEQIFNESLGSESFEEIDASIAWRLQQEEDAQIPSSMGSRRQSQLRVPSMRHLYRWYPSHSSENPPRQLRRHSSENPPRQLPRRSSENPPRQLRWHSPMARIPFRRNLNIREIPNHLEVLEATFDHIDGPTSLLHVERDFNENDYEMLLALDDENHSRAGASTRRINTLPLSVVQTENPEEKCVICLDAHSIGDKIRHLPCLHKFHKKCIDTWLKRKTSCPICKSDVT